MRILVKQDIDIAIKYEIVPGDVQELMEKCAEDNFAETLKPLCIHYKTSWVSDPVNRRGTFNVKILDQKITLDEESVEEFLGLFYSFGVYLELNHIEGLRFELGYTG